MGADVTTAVPAVVGVIESRTAPLLRGDGATVSPCTNQSRGWRAECHGTSTERLLTRVAQRLRDKAKQGSEAVARLRRRVGRGRGLRSDAGSVGSPDMDEEAEQPESDQEELGKPQVWCHDKVPSHRDERRPFYRSHLRPY